MLIRLIFLALITVPFVAAAQRSSLPTFTINSPGDIASLTAPFDGPFTLDGHLYIAHTDLEDLRGLENLARIAGKLTILNNEDLRTLDGLENLTEAGGLHIETNPRLENLDALANLTSLLSIFTYTDFYEEERNRIYSGLEIANNQALQNLHGLRQVAKLGTNLTIRDNPSLPNLAGLESLPSRRSGRLDITGNERLVSLEGLESVRYISDKVRIADNPSLVSLTGLDNLQTVSGDVELENNAFLSDLSALQNLARISDGGTLVIARNNSLPNLRGLDNLHTLENYHGQTGHMGMIVSEDWSPGTIIIEENAALRSLAGLAGPSTLRTLRIRDNPKLNDLSALQFVQALDSRLEIAFNGSLQTLTGLENLGAIRTLEVVGNTSLPRRSALFLAAQVGKADLSSTTIADNFNPLLPDFNASGRVDMADFFLFAAQFDRLTSLHNAHFDLNGDARIDYDDFYAFVEKFGQSVAAP